MRGQEWKDIRSSVTPAFTTGKIKRVNNQNNFECKIFTNIFCILKRIVFFCFFKLDVAVD